MLSFTITVTEVNNPRTIDLNFSNPFLNLKVIKEKWKTNFGTPIAQQRIFFQGNELFNNRKLIDYNIDQNTQLYIITQNREASLQIYGNCQCSSECNSLIQQCARGLAIGLIPQLALDGTGGTYFLRDVNRKKIAVFKPMDEEPYAPKNPRGHCGPLGQPGFRRGILSGEAHLREIAAHFLDHGGFSSVPPTVRVELFPPQHSDELTSKIGSLQTYIDFDDYAGDLGVSNFSVQEVQKIAILDIRILNTDRNDANILVKRNEEGRICLIPIDHGYSMPDTLEVGWCDWVWLEWPQVKQPLTQASLRYIENIDILSEIEYLKRNLNIRTRCLQVLLLSNLVLKKGAKAGLNLFQIASLIIRNELDEFSDIEVFWKQAKLLSRHENHNCNHHKTLARCVSQIDLREIEMCNQNHGQNEIDDSAHYPDELLLDLTNPVYDCFSKLLEPAFMRILLRDQNLNPIIAPTPFFSYQPVPNFEIAFTSSPQSYSPFYLDNIMSPKNNSSPFNNFQLDGITSPSLFSLNRKISSGSSLTTNTETDSNSSPLLLFDELFENTQIPPQTNEIKNCK